MLKLENLSAESLANKYGTPVYVYEETAIKDSFRKLHKAFPVKDLRIHFATKANTNPWILRILEREGAWADVVSPGEIKLAKLSGFPVNRMLYNGNSASEQEIKLALKEGVRINVESLSQLNYISKNAPETEISIRFNIFVGGGHHSHVITGGPESKFGIDWERVKDVRTIANRGKIKIVGLHCHIGSGVLDAQLFVNAVSNLLSVAKNFPKLQVVNFGGGIGIPYRKEEPPIKLNDLGELLVSEYEKFCSEYDRIPAIALEPGRFLVAKSGTLICQVTSINQGRKYLFVGTNTGFNHLIRPAMYGSYHHIEAVNPRSGDKFETVITGNICESGDVFTRNEEGIVPRELPLLKIGDYLAIRDAGAYGFSMASRYNSFPLPAELLLNSGNVQVIRHRENLSQLVANVPAFKE